MSSRLHEIEISNFKAFRHFALNLEGRHVLVYGANGSGKSSLYWALYTFLQSARKQKGSVSKYFDPGRNENLLNIHEQAQSTPRHGGIALTFRDMPTKIDTAYRINKEDHGTFQQPAILKGDLASDFITYRFFFGFSDFRNSETFNVWPLFEEEILPFCVSTGGKNPMDCWSAIRSGNPNPFGERGISGRNAYDDFRQKTAEFAGILPGIVDSISVEAQGFYDEFFAIGDSAKISLALKVTTLPSFSGTDRATAQFTVPVVQFGIQVDGQTIKRPQSYLNEAKLTQLALSVRFAASLVNLHQSEIKLLVLDDLLVSLDMSNRMKVVEIILSKKFDSYQKIIMTHDLGFFREFHRLLGANHAAWCAVRLDGKPSTTIDAVIEKTQIEKADEYLQGYRLDEAALCLRKAAEETARRFNHRDDNVESIKSFTSLSSELQAAKKRLIDQLPVRLYEQIIRNTPEGNLDKLVTTDTRDIDGDPDLDATTKGLLKAKRRELHKLISKDNAEILRKIILIDEVLACRERVLNPAAHAGFYPRYFHEVQHALRLIRQLEADLA